MGIKQVNQSLSDRHIAHSTKCSRNLTQKYISKCAKVCKVALTPTLQSLNECGIETIRGSRLGATES